MAWRIALVLLGVLLLSGGTYVVPEWQQALVTQLGQPIRMVREPGF